MASELQAVQSEAPNNKQEKCSINFADNQTVKNDQSHAETYTQLAVDATGFGKFNYKITIVSGLICMNVALGIDSLGFILPTASCDYYMNTVDKGRIAASFIFGMLCGGYICGCLGDVMGRRYTLLRCVFLQAIIECIGSLIPNYWCLVTAKMIFGFALGGQLSTLYTYVGEFQPTIHRKRILSTTEFAFVLGTILCPVIAWLVIPINVNIRLNGFFFHSWNLFMVCASIPSWITAVWLVFLPETPKYLAEFGQKDQLDVVLTRMYVENTGKSSDEYFAELQSRGIPSTHQLIKETNKDETENKIRQFFKMFVFQTIILLKPPYLSRTLLVCTIMFSTFSSLYTLGLWFPELFDRFANFEKLHPNTEASVCIVSKDMYNMTKSSDPTLEFKHCEEGMDNKVYLHTLTLGLVALPVGIVFPIFINKLGFKAWLIIGMAISACTTGGLFFVRSSIENTILCAIFQALISVCATIICCVVVEIFPTNLRTTAAALSSICARGGALIGNVTFSYLIDNYCSILIIFLTSEILVGGVLAIFLPVKQATSSDKKSRPTDTQSSVT